MRNDYDERLKELKSLQEKIAESKKEKFDIQRENLTKSFEKKKLEIDLKTAAQQKEHAEGEALREAVRKLNPNEKITDKHVEIIDARMKSYISHVDNLAQEDLVGDVKKLLTAIHKNNSKFK